jgi:hypothetical protein
VNTSIFEPLTVPSIQQRLMRALVGASVIWVLVVSATVWSVIQHQVDELADAGLQESGELLYGLMATLKQPLPTGLTGDMLPAPLASRKSHLATRGAGRRPVVAFASRSRNFFFRSIDTRSIKLQWRLARVWPVATR